MKGKLKRKKHRRKEKNCIKDKHKNYNHVDNIGIFIVIAPDEDKLTKSFQWNTH